jgi:hypothetical protein
MRDEKMLEKLVTHNVQDVSELLSLVDKCARAVEGRVWHSQPAPETGKADKPEVDVAAQSSNRNRNRKKKKVGGNNNNKLLAGAPTAVVAVGGGHGPRGDKRLRQPSDSDEGGPRCSVPNSRRHSVEESREIKMLAEQFCK